MRAPGFTLVEGLIAAVLVMLVMALSLGLFTGSFQGFVKGEDTLSSVQEASLVMARLRRDLLSLAFRPPGAGCDVRHVRAQPNARHVKEVVLDPRATTLRTAVASTYPPAGQEGQTYAETTFYVGGEAGGPPRAVTYTYHPDRACIVRAEGSAPPVSYALPRMKDFELDLLYQPRPVPEPPGSPPVAPTTAAPAHAFGLGNTGATPYGQLWFAVRFSVQAEEREVGGAATTRVDLETRVFPKHVNRRAFARWSTEP